MLKNKIIIHVFMSSLTFLVFIMPGVLFSFINLDYKFRFELAFLAAFIPAAIVLPLVRPRIFATFILALFCLMETVQFGHYFYYNAPLNVFAFDLMLTELGEIAESASAMMDKGGGVYTANGDSTLCGFDFFIS